MKTNLNVGDLVIIKSTNSHNRLEYLNKIGKIISVVDNGINQIYLLEIVGFDKNLYWLSNELKKIN